MVKELSLVTPFFNEEENIEELCRAVDAYAKGKPFKIEMILVDDGSIDNSVAILKEQKLENITAKLVKLSKNYGSHVAIRAGINSATTEYCMFFSADLQEPVEIIGQMVDELELGYDYVCARKKVTGTGYLERNFSNLYSVLVRKLAVKSFPTGGVNNILFNNKIKENLERQAERNSSIFLQIIDMGYKMGIVDVEYGVRKRGTSKWTLGKRIKLLIDSFVSFSFFPIRLVTAVGFFLFFCGVFTGLLAVIIKFFHLMPLAMGWPTLISIIAMGFGITNISLGIIAEYMWRTYDYTRSRAVYLVDETIKLG